MVGTGAQKKSPPGSENGADFGGPAAQDSEEETPVRSGHRPRKKRKGCTRVFCEHSTTEDEEEDDDSAKHVKGAKRLKGDLQSSARSWFERNLLTPTKRVGVLIMKILFVLPSLLVGRLSPV